MYDPTALDGFSSIALWFAPGDIRPNLNVRQPEDVGRRRGLERVHHRLVDVVGQLADPVSAVLMHNNVYNEFVLDATTKSQTDWVVTFPTKWAYYSRSRRS